MARTLFTVATMALPVLGLQQNDGCTAAGSFKTTESTHNMEGGKMFCKYPTNTNMTFPFLSFEHGDTQGGFLLHLGYRSFLEAVASSGFVICAPLMCPLYCRAQQSIHQLHAITAAKTLGSQGVLPIRSNGTVGVIGHSTGGMTTLKCSYADAVTNYSIGSAVVYNGDGGHLINNDDLRFEDIAPSLPMFLVTGTRDIIEPTGSTQSDVESILKANPKQPLLVAEINGEGHLDNIDFPFHPAPLRATPYIIAFMGYTLIGSSQCAAEYKRILDVGLITASSEYYKNQLFNSNTEVVV